MELHTDLRFAPKEGDLIAFDEADEYIFGQPSEFLQLTKANACICFTATFCDAKQGVEQRVLDFLNIKVLIREETPLPPGFTPIQVQPD